MDVTKIGGYAYDMELDEYGPIGESIGVALDGPMSHRGKVFWSKADGSVTCGLWEVDAGRFSCAFDGEGEMVHVVKGRSSRRRTPARSSSSVRAISTPSRRAGPASGRCRRRCASSSRPSRNSRRFALPLAQTGPMRFERVTSSFSASTSSLTLQLIDSTTPSAGASHTISIFIAESVTRG